jgi:lipoprotein-anchoring transpeptidase ErfK/SrfK
MLWGDRLGDAGVAGGVWSVDMRAVRVLLLAVVVGFVGLFSTAAAAPAALRAPDLVAQPAMAAVTSPDGLPAVSVPADVMAQAAAPEPVTPPAPKAPSIVPGTPCLDTASACVDLSAKKAWLISDGAIAYGPVPITSGRKGFRTPPGTFKVSFKSKDHVSSIYDAAMPNSVFFNGGVAFHQGSLKVQSHGCIHLSRTASAQFFAALSRGDVVQVKP